MDEEYNDKKEICNIIENFFINYDGVSLNTPIIQEKKLYDKLFDNNTFLIIDDDHMMRYNSNIPFIDYIIKNNISTMRRYSFDKIYKKSKEKDNIETERCVFNIVGSGDSYLQEYEIMNLIVDVLHNLSISNFKIKINTTCIFHQLFNFKKSDEKYSSFTSLLREYKDDLEKLKSHLITEGFDIEVTDDTISKINQIQKLINNEDKIKYLKDFDTRVLSYLIDDDFLKQYLIIDPLFSTNFEIYSGIIYKIIENNSKKTIAFGGRCDDFIGKKYKKNIPLICVSFDLDRIYRSFKQEDKNKSSKRKVYYVASIGSKLDKKRLEVATFLRNKGYCVKTKL